MPPRDTGITLRQSTDRSLNHSLFVRVFTPPEWPGDHHTFWVAWRGEQPVGFCSAVFLPIEGAVFLSSAGVLPVARGKGLQRRMIATRCRWARQHGARWVVTYAVAGNWPSLTNLLRAGFRVYEPASWWAGRSAVYLQRAA